MNNELLELYTDYLISRFGAATATSLSERVDGTLSSDRVTRFLSEREYLSRDLWLQVKQTVREVERDDAVLIFDTTIQEKPWTDESELIGWPFDPCQNRTGKGLNFLNAWYPSGGGSIPVDFRLIRKPIQFGDGATRPVKRASAVTKNELLHQQGRQYGSAESGVQGSDGRWRTGRRPSSKTVESRGLSQIAQSQGRPRQIADPDPSHPAEPRVHDTLRRVQTECLTMTYKLNHFALRAKLYVKAIQHAFSELARLKAA
jgi:hypothetical protein